MGALFGGALFAAAIIGWFWVGTLISVGAGLHPLAVAGERIAQAAR
jgi:hypothetical protein